MKTKTLPYARPLNGLIRPDGEQPITTLLVPPTVLSPNTNAALVPPNNDCASPITTARLRARTAY